MHIRGLTGKSICILGYGREGQAMAEALETYAKGCSIVVADRNSELRMMNYELRSGKKYLENLDHFDVVIKSPGIPPSELPAKLPAVTTSTQIFLDSIKDSGATVIGVTGSKGKSTTASLIHAILNAAGKRSFLIGNIGEPAISHIADANSNTIFVQEMSSYQLMNLTSSPQIAVITSFFPEHLDYHGSTSLTTGSPLENYLEAKKHITRFQRQDDLVFYSGDSDVCREIAQEGGGKKIPVRIIDAPTTLNQTKLQGQHNLMNIALAWKVAERLGVTKKDAIKAITTFTPLPHRLKSLGVIDGIEWVNDSISTTPQSAIAALDALGDRVRTIILGGQDRGYDFTPLVDRLKSSSVKTVILMPDSGATIRKKLEEASAKLELVDVQTMAEVVFAAKESIKNATFSILHSTFPIVLLSPAAPSYGHFKNFEDRGEQFRACLRL